MRPVARRRAVFTFALAAMFLASQVSSFTHELLVKHVTCLEHGERLHAEDGVASHVPEADSPALMASPAEVSGHGHEHCLATAARREELGVPPAVGVAISAPVARFIASAFEVVVTESPVALLRLAPKASPPV